MAVWTSEARNYGSLSPSLSVKSCVKSHGVIVIQEVKWLVCLDA